MLEESRFHEVLQQTPAHLPVEASHLRGVRGRERRAGVHEQTPDTSERVFDTSSLEWLRHGRSSLRRVHSRITAPRRAGV
jgi:hypothetical protein